MTADTKTDTLSEKQIPISQGIPKRLQHSEHRFILLKPRDKVPFEQGWQTTANYAHDNPRVLRHLETGGNVGLLCSPETLICIDFDDESCELEVAPNLPATFTVRSGGKGRKHLYYHCPDAENMVVKDGAGKTLADVQCSRKNIVIPPSVHASGRAYTVDKDVAPAKISMPEIRAAFGRWVKDEKKATHSLARNRAAEHLKSRISLSSVLDHCGIQHARGLGPCPAGHPTESGKCFHHEDAKGVGYCFNCQKGWDIIGIVEEREACDFRRACSLLATWFNVKMEGQPVSSTDGTCSCVQEADALYSRETKKGESLKPTIGQYLVHFISKHASFFKDEYDQTWGILEVKGHRETWKVSTNGQKFISWAGHLYWNHKNDVASIPAIRNAINSLTSTNLPSKTVHKRYWWEGDALCVAMHDESWNVLRVRKDACDLVQNDGQFRKYGHELPFVFKASGPDGWKTAYDLFFNKVFPKTSDEARYILTILLTAFMVPDVPAPAIVFYGFAGSGKSTATKLCTDLVDPQSSSRMALKEDVKEAVRELSQRWVTGYDNLQYFRPEMSDLFCQHITGGTSTARALYTDEDSVSKKMFGRLILNGIPVVARANDLLRRAITIECFGVPDEKLIDDSLIYRQADLLMPFIRAEMLVKVIQARELLPQIEVTSGTMPGFARWAEAISCAYGHPYGTFDKIYAGFLEEQVAETADNSPICSSLTIVLEKHRAEMPWRVTTKDLLAELRENADWSDTNQKAWPANSRSLLGALGASKRWVLKLLYCAYKYPYIRHGTRYILFSSVLLMNQEGADRVYISGADGGYIAGAYGVHNLEEVSKEVSKNNDKSHIFQKNDIHWIIRDLLELRNKDSNIDFAVAIEHIVPPKSDIDVNKEIRAAISRGDIIEVRSGILRIPNEVQNIVHTTE